MDTLLTTDTSLIALNTALRPIAYSLIRFSTPGQADGDSYRRQFAPQQAFCDARKWELDLSLHHASLRKFAVSASKDIKKTPSYRFVMMVEAGALPRDRQLILLAEDIDRMARGIHDVVYDLCLRLLRAGCWICTTADATIYTLAEINDNDQTGKRDKLQRKLDAARDYSVKLGNRVRESWIGRAERVEAGETILTEASSEWLDVIDNQYVVNPVRGGTVRHIHYLGRVCGFGKRKVAQLLNADLDMHPAWRGSDWHPSAVQRVWENRAVFGEATLFNRKKVKPRYYPPVLAGPSGENGTYTDADYEQAERLFYLGEAARKGRRHKGPLHKGERHASILPSAECTCKAYDKDGKVKHGKLHYVDKSKGNRYLACDNALRHVLLVDGSTCRNHRHYQHSALEVAMLAILPSFDFTKLLVHPDPHTTEIAAIEAEIHSKAERSRWLATSGAMTGTTLAAIAQLDAEVDALRDRLTTLHKEIRIAEAEAKREAFAEFIALASSMRALPEDDPECVRMRSAIAQELRRIVDVIRVEGDGLTAWLATDQLPVRIGIGLSGRTFTRPVIIMQTDIGREEFPVTFRETCAENPPEGTGCLEAYVNGEIVAKMDATIRRLAARERVGGAF